MFFSAFRPPVSCVSPCAGLNGSGVRSLPRKTTTTLSRPAVAVQSTGIPADTWRPVVGWKKGFMSEVRIFASEDA